jgi:hypothetical protein
MGTARKLPDWGEIVSFFDALAAASDRVEVERLGETTDGLPYIAVFVSSPENLARREERRAALGKLWDARMAQREDEPALLEETIPTAFLLCTQHSNEIGAAIMTLELASELASQDDPDTREILDNVMTVIIPSHNPDGIQMIVEWYRQWLGTPYEGQGMPWLYHRYVGHDNNRDWFMLTQKESRLYVALHNREHPQLVFDMHQMYRDGARFMVPPFIDPLDPNQDPVIQQGFADLGTAIATRLTAAGKAGVATNIIFDNYSPSLAYGNYHGSVDLLSEAASCNLATPVTIEEDAFSTERGFDPQVRTWNHPMPWKGGEWTLSDIVEYDRIAALAFLEHAARNRRQWLRNYAGIQRRMIERDYERDKLPYAYIMPVEQRDPGTAYELLETLQTGLVEIEEATAEFTADGVRYPAGTRVIRLAQPAGNYAKTLLELQVYPDLRRWPDGPPSAPYDIAGHTLSLQMGVRAIEVKRPFDAELQPATIEQPVGSVIGEGLFGYAIPVTANASILALNRALESGLAVHRLCETHPTFDLAPGTIILPAQDGLDGMVARLAQETGVEIVGLDEPLEGTLIRQEAPRVGVYQSWRPEIDEGWTRLIFERFELPYDTLHDDDIRQGNLRQRFDVILLPQQRPADLLNGNPEKNKYKEPYPPEYVGGLGPVGAEALRAFAEAGGTIVALDSSSEFAIQHLYLPVKNAVAGVAEEDFYCPGSLLRVVIDTSHPIGYGMPRDGVALFMKSPVFEVSGPGAGEVDVPVSYPNVAQNLSGWILGSEKLAGKAAVVDVPVGAGRAVLIGFRPQFRAQARGTYKILFNAVLSAAQGKPEMLRID